MCFHFFQQLNDLFSCDGWKIIQEFVQGLIALNVVKEVENGVIIGATIVGYLWRLGRHRDPHE